MNKRRISLLVRLLVPLSLTSCAWLPPTKKQVVTKPVPAALTPAAASSTSVITPPFLSWQRTSASISSRDMDASVTNKTLPPVPKVTVVPDGRDKTTVTAPTPMRPPAKPSVVSGPYAPLNENEWHELFTYYRRLAQCEDRYMHSAGLNRRDVAQRLVAMHQAGKLRRHALRLLGKHSPLRRQWATQSWSAAQQTVLVDQTLLAFMRDHSRVGLGPLLVRKAMARYYAAQVTGGVCPIKPRYRTLLDKAVSHFDTR